MTRRSPTLEGFKVMFQRPSFGLAEIAWRWSFGAAAATLIVFSFFEYLDTLPVTAGDRLLLKTRQPVLISRAIAHVFRGSAMRVMEVALVLALALAVGWIAIAALGRAATVKGLLAHFRETTRPTRARLSPLFGLNFFRVVAALAACVGFLGAFLMAYLVSPHSAPEPGIAFVVVLGTAWLVWLAWSLVNWFLSLASVFVFAQEEDTFGAMFSAIDLCRRRAGSLFAAGTWFGLAHVGAFVLATMVVALPLGLTGMLRARLVLIGVLLITLFYFAVVDFLYVGRLAAHVAILELPDTPVLPETTRPVFPPRMQSAPIIQPAGAVDPDELILSDLPV